MGNIIESDFMCNMIKAANDMWLKGWDERNGGNISVRLSKEDVRSYGLDASVHKRSGVLSCQLPNLADEYFLVTGSGKYFRNVILDPEDTLGIIVIHQDGKTWSLLWGLLDGANPTSELSAHLMSHSVRKEISDGRDRAVIHTHATNLLSLTYRYKADSKVFTRKLWEMCTECLVVFPDGVGVLPWMVPGTDDIGNATASLMRKHRIVLWTFHGLVGCGSTLDETFGLIDTAEKAAEILVKVDSMGGLTYGMTDKNLSDLAVRFGVTPMEGIISHF